MDIVKTITGAIVTLGVGYLAVASIYQIGKSQNAVPLFADANVTVRNFQNNAFK